MTLWTVALQAPLSKRFSRKEYWSGLPCPPPGHLPHSGLKCQFLCPLFSFSSVSGVRHFATPWTAARQASLSITSSQSVLKLMSIESVMPSNHLILCHPLLLLPRVPPSFRFFSNESTLRMRWPKYWSFSFSISPSNECSGLISFRMDLFGFLALQGTLRSLLQCLFSLIYNNLLMFRLPAFCCQISILTWLLPSSSWGSSLRAV